MRDKTSLGMSRERRRHRRRRRNEIAIMEKFSIPFTEVNIALG
jgi:hypothetical protein